MSAPEEGKDGYNMDDDYSRRVDDAVATCLVPLDTSTPLDALASAALQASSNEQQKQLKDESKEKWFTVGIFKNLQQSVTSYIDYEEWNSNISKLTSDNIPELAGLKRIPLETGQAYRFRICGINTFGRGEFSEVSFLIFHYKQ